jgi:hypothetical protein
MNALLLPLAYGINNALLRSLAFVITGIGESAKRD